MAVISVEEYNKALTSLKEALNAHQIQKDENLQKMLRDASIRRFGLSVELAWKTSVRLLGLTTSAPKPAIRELARAGLINNVDLWFEFIEARNKSSYAYDDDIAAQVFSVTQKFVAEGVRLLDSLSIGLCRQ